MPTFSIDTVNEVDFQEGVQGTFKVVGYVPSGQPQLTFQGLPTGAVYDPTAGTVTWTPDYNAANDPNDPTVVVKTYTVTITLNRTSGQTA